MLTVDPTFLDLGRIPFGKPSNFQFDIKNTGKVPLQITKLWVGCSSCTKATVKKDKLADGECTIVDVVFTPGTLGPQKKNVQIQWNGNETIKLEFIAESYAQS